MFDRPVTEHAVYERCGQRIRTVTKQDFVGLAIRRGYPRRMHLFATADGREEECRGPGYCVECSPGPTR